VSDIVKIRVDKDTYEIDFDTLTLGELEVIEREFDKSIAEVDLASARGILILAWIAKRRQEPLCSLDEIRALPQSAVEIDEGDADPLPDVDQVGDDDSGTQS